DVPAADDERVLERARARADAVRGVEPLVVLDHDVAAARELEQRVRHGRDRARAAVPVVRAGHAAHGSVVLGGRVAPRGGRGALLMGRGDDDGRVREAREGDQGGNGQGNGGGAHGAHAYRAGRAYQPLWMGALIEASWRRSVQE